ncbi:MAG: trypsin-like serine peptidase [Acidimicrobiia bacterium]
MTITRLRSIAGLFVVGTIVAASFAAAGPAGANDPWADARNARPLPPTQWARPNFVIGTDTRVKVKDTTIAPYKRVVFIIGQLGSYLYSCSGAMISPNTVATAGHCVYNRPSSSAPMQYATNVRVYPGANADGPPFGRCNGVALYPSAAWVDRQAMSYDYAAIKLDCNIGNTVGWFALDTAPDMQIGWTTQLLGYPADKATGSQWTASGIITNITARRVTYNNDTYSGTSGGPVLRKFGTVNKIVAINAYQSYFENSGTRITPAVLSDFNSWIAR